MVDRALAIDPLNVCPRSFYGIALLSARRQDLALAQARGVIRAQPGGGGALSTVLFAQHMKRQYADAIAAASASCGAMCRPDVAEGLKKGYAEPLVQALLRKMNLPQ